MANYREDIVNIDLECGTLHRSFLRHSIGKGDALANRFGVRVFRGKTPVQLVGTCSGYFVRADGATVPPINGVISNNVAYVTLTEECYEVEGVFALAIKIKNGNEKVTLRIVDGIVDRTSTDILVDPGTIIPSIDTLINAINTAVSQIPQDYSKLQNDLRSKAIINDIVETSFIPAVIPLDDTGVVTSGKAWRAEIGEVDGSQYQYITYQVPSDYAGNIAIIYGHGWGEPYPLVCFYDGNMTFISSAGLRADTAYKGLPVVIPANTATIVINARSDETFPVGVAFYNIADFVSVVKKVGVYGRIMNSTILEEFPEYADARNWPTNCVYSLAYGIASQIRNLPVELSSYATIIKVNGMNGAQLAGGGGYNLYICANEYNLWIGFDNTDALIWRLISGNATSTTKYLLIGDSYGDGYSHYGNNSGWCTYFVNEMGLSSSQYEKRHQGGSGFANGGFLARLNAATGAGFTDIIVLGGFNDYNATDSAIDDAISTFCSRARALFPAAKIHIGCVGWIKEGTGESAYQNWQDVRDAITGKVLPVYQRCAKHGAEYINFAEYLLTDAMMTPTDGYHPGETGNKVIAHGVINASKTGCACIPFKSVLKG